MHYDLVEHAGCPTRSINKRGLSKVDPSVDSLGRVKPGMVERDGTDNNEVGLDLKISMWSLDGRGLARW